MSETIHILSGRNLKKEYIRKDRKITALGGVDFHLDRREVLGIVGESGSGKSTLLRLISGIEKPDGGELLHRFEPYHGGNPGECGKFLQMIFQDAYGSFDPHLTMEKSLMEAAGSDVREEMEEILEKVGLDESLLAKRPRNLSGGQCQRMAIARALLRHVEVLLCDEVTSALDVSIQAKVVRLLFELNRKEDLSIIFVSHDIALVSNICDRIMVMKDGKCVEEGPTTEVISNPKSDYTRSLLESSVNLGR